MVLQQQRLAEQAKMEALPHIIGLKNEQGEQLNLARPVTM